MANMLDMFEIDQDSKPVEALESFLKMVVRCSPDTNKWICLKAGAFNEDDFFYPVKAGSEFRNEFDTVEDDIRQGIFPSGTIFVNYTRDLDKNEEDEMTKSLLDKYSFCVVDKTIARKLTGERAAEILGKEPIDRLSKLLEKRWAYENKINKRKASLEEEDFS